MTSISSTILIFLAASIPLSLVIIKSIVALFAKHDMTLGKVSTICTNVIGSLTQSKLALKTFYYDEHLFEVLQNKKIEAENLDNKDKFSLELPELKKDETLKLVAIASAFCHYKKMQALEDEANNFLAQSGFSQNAIISDFHILSELPTDKKKKISSVVAKNLDDESIFSFSKGNPYAILKRCKRIQIKDQKVELTPRLRRKIHRRLDKLNMRGYKVIAFAYKGLPKKQYQHYSEDFAENDLVFTSIFAFINPINNWVRSSIELAKKNDIKMYIVTGTQEKKAIALGIELGIINPNYFESITGSQLGDLNDKKLAKMLTNREKDYVFSEMKNSEKQMIFHALKQNGETIALTDRHDERSLEKLLTKILHGRSFHQGYLKCVYHTWIIKIAELFLLTTALITQSPIALTLSSIIIIDLFVNTLLGLSLKAEKSNHKLKNKAGTMIIEGVIMGIILTIIYVFSSLKHGWTLGQKIDSSSPLIFKTTTMIFVSITILQIINAYRIKNSGKSLISNIHLALSSIILGLMIYMVTNIEIIQQAFGFSRLSADEWQVIAFSIIVFMVIHYFKAKFNVQNPPTRLPEDQSLAQES